MSLAFLILTVVIAVICLSYNLLKRRVGYITVPFLGSAIILAWFLPQALIVVNKEFLPAGGVTTMMGMAFGSVLCIVIGWHHAHRRYRPAYSPRPRVRTTHLMTSIKKIPYNDLVSVTGLFAVTASAIQIAILSQPSEALLARQPTGIITILKMLTALNPVALSLSLGLVFFRRNAVTLALLGLALANFVVPILVSFKRNEIVEMCLVMAFALWAYKGLSIPRLALPFLAVLGLVGLTGAGAVRGMSGFELSRTGEIAVDYVSLDDLKSINLTDTLTEGLSSRADEIVNGIYALDYANRNEIPTLGMRFWNQFVTRWIPGQLIGKERKEEMLFALSDVRVALAASGAQWQVGTTSTGFTEVYLDFSFLGAFAFYLMAYHARKIFDQGISGDLSAAAIYPSLAVLCMVSITHGGYSYFLTLPLLLGSRLVVRYITGGASPSPIRRQASGKLSVSAQVRS